MDYRTKQRATAETGANKVKSTPKCALVSEAEKKRLFDLYIVPNFTSIKVLTVRYTDRYQDVDDNYNHVLFKLYNYIGNYDPSKSLETWIHIVTKRECFHQNDKRNGYNSYQTDMEMCSSENLHQHGTANIVDASFGTLIDNVSDQLYEALLQIPPTRVSPFLLYVQGHGIREITNIEWQNGHLEKKSEDLIKSRIYWAKMQLQLILKRNGITRSVYSH